MFYSFDAGFIHINANICRNGTQDTTNSDSSEEYIKFPSTGLMGELEGDDVEAVSEEHCSTEDIHKKLTIEMTRDNVKDYQRRHRISSMPQLK